MTVIATVGATITKIVSIAATIKHAANAFVAVTRRVLRSALRHREQVRAGVAAEPLSLAGIAAVVLTWLEDQLDITVTARGIAAT